MKKTSIALSLALLLSFSLAACAPQADDSQQKIAVIVALTQTADALQAPPATAAPTQTPASGYLPLSAEECAALNNALSSAAGYPGAIASPVPFEDFQTGQTGNGCQIRFQTSGLDMENFEPLVNPVASALLAAGWTEDLAYGAGGAGGYGTAFRKDSTLCLTLVESKPSDPALCPADQPMAVCWANLLPQQKTFNLTLNCATYVP